MVPLIETRRVLSLLYSLNAEGSFLVKVHPFREKLYKAGAMQDRESELLRIPLPRSPVNKGPGLQKSSALSVGYAAIVPMSWRPPPLWQLHEFLQELPSRGRVESVGDVRGSARDVPGYGNGSDDLRVAQEVRAARVAVAGAGVPGGWVLREAQEGLVERGERRDRVHPRPVLAEDRGTASGLVGAFRGPVAYRREALALESAVVGQLVEQARAGQQSGLDVGDLLV